MARANPLLSNFTAGVLSPRLNGRADISWYHNGCQVLQNMLVDPRGPASRRCGTVFVAETKAHDKTTRVVEFEYSTEQAYCLILGDLNLRFGKDQGVIVAPNVASAIANGDFTSGIASWTDRSAGTGALSHDATNKRLSLDGAGSGNEARAYQAVSVAAGDQASEHVLAFEIFGTRYDEITVRIGTSAGGSQIGTFTRAAGGHCIGFTPNAATVYVEFDNGLNKSITVDNVSLIDNAAVEIAAPWAHGDLMAIQYTQSADVWYGCHASYWPAKIERYGHTTWSVREIPFSDGPYLDENTTATTLTPAATSGYAVTVTASAVTGINGGDGFLSTDVGRLVRIQHGSTWGWGVIVSVTSTTAVKVDIQSAFGGTSGVAVWQLGAWCETTGHPGCVSFFQERLSFAGPTSYPGRVDMSVAGGFETFTPGADADDAIAITIASNRVNAARWMVPFRKSLIVGTQGNEIRLGSDELQGTVTPTNIEAAPTTQHGSANVRALPVTNAVLFVQRAGRKVRELAYMFDRDNYAAPDMAERAEHLFNRATEGQIRDMAWQEEPWGVLWCVRDDGLLCGLTYLRAQEVIAWHTHPLGGTDAKVESVAVIPGNGVDELWMVVSRTIDGGTKRYIERLADPFYDDADDEDYYGVDCGLTYDGAAATTITGLDHLEGETVQVCADGAPASDATVASGQITLATAASKVHVGLGFTAELVPMHIEAGAVEGTAQGRQKMTPKLTLRLHRSGAFKYGPSRSAADLIEFRVPADLMDAAPPLYTGDKEVDVTSDLDTFNDIYIIADLPLPLTIVCLVPEMVAHEG